MRWLIALLPEGKMAYVVEDDPRISRVRIGPREDIPPGDEEYHKSLRRLCLRDFRGSECPPGATVK